MMSSNVPSDGLPDSLSRGQEALPSFEQLYDRYYVQIYRYVYAHLGNEQDAADILQHVFLQAWQARQTYRSERGTIATWLFSIARHRLVDFYRVSHPSLSWESLPDMPATDGNPESAVLSEERIVLARKLLAALPPGEQELLALRFAARLSSAEIAVLIGKSEAATKKRLTRLLHRLQEQYRLRELATPLPGLLVPDFSTCVAMLFQTYAAVPSTQCVRDSRQYLLKLIHPVLA